MVTAIVIALFILLVAISVLVSIHFCIVGRTLVTRRSHGQTNNNNNNSMRMKGVSGELKNLPCFDYEEKGSNLVDCAVCLESFKDGDACRLLPNCSHSFHVQCIDSWILNTPFCPICRTWVIVRGETAVSVPVPVSVSVPVPHSVEIEILPMP